MSEWWGKMKRQGNIIQKCGKIGHRPSFSVVMVIIMQGKKKRKLSTK